MPWMPSPVETRHAPRLPFPPPDVPVIDDAVNETDNTANCGMVWQTGEPATIQGCCRVQDTYLVASTAPDDPPHHLHGGGDSTPDDRLAMGFSPDLDPTDIGGGVSFEMNNREGTGGEGPGGRPTHQDVRCLDGGGSDASFDWVTEAGAVRTDGLEYTLEWRAEVPFDISSGDTPVQRGHHRRRSFRHRRREARRAARRDGTVRQRGELRRLSHLGMLHFRITRRPTRRIPSHISTRSTYHTPRRRRRVPLVESARRGPVARRVAPRGVPTSPRYSAGPPMRCRPSGTSPTV